MSMPVNSPNADRLERRPLVPIDTSLVVKGAPPAKSKMKGTGLKMDDGVRKEVIVNVSNISAVPFYQNLIYKQKIK